MWYLLLKDLNMGPPDCNYPSQSIVTGKFVLYENWYVISLIFLQINVSNATLNFVAFMCSLWGGSVLNLGTKKHKDKYYDVIDNLEYPGCFAMTELHHGRFICWYPGLFCLLIFQYSVFHYFVAEAYHL